MKDSQLYQEILNHNFDEGYTPDPGHSFEEKLQRANAWTEEETKLNIREYKRFMYLLIWFGVGAPSDTIDQVWHQHILYTKDYTKFCIKHNDKFIHHAPSRHTGDSDLSYRKMLVNYEEEFGEKPGDVWALKAVDYKRVDLAHNYLVPNDLASAIKVFFIILSNKLFH